MKLDLSSRLPNFLKSKAGGSNVPAQHLAALHLAGRAVWTPRNMEALAREGFMKNAIVYRCVRMIAEAASSVPWILFAGKKELDSHPILNLLQLPNQSQSGIDMLENWYGHLQLTGNAYLELVSAGENKELHCLRPDRMRVITDTRGQVAGYEYEINGKKIRWSKTQQSTPILHTKLFHPINDYYGLSPIEAAAYGIDIHNAAGQWSKSLLDNSARPSGALVYRGQDGSGNLTQEQFSRLKEELVENYEGASNAGRPLLLEGGLEWTSMGHTPRDMDFIATKHVAAREIALAFGVPPMLLGIPGDNTFSNYAEANRTFWRQTIMPLVKRAAQGLMQFLHPHFPSRQPLRLSFDSDKIEALAQERETLWKRIGESNFLTLNEKRAALGYQPLQGGDALNENELGNSTSVPSRNPAR